MSIACSFPLILTSSSIFTSKPKQLLPSSSYPLTLHRLSPPICTATTHFGYTRPLPLLLHKTTPSPRLCPAAASPSDAIPVPGDNATSTIISALLFIAFIGLSILTIGVIYIGVTDFLQKREGEKFQKEEEARKKKSGGRKRRMKARAGPKGFGQTIVEIDEAADDI